MTKYGEGTIRADEAYTLVEFSRRTGLKDWAIRSARKHGLRVTKIGNRSFVKGGDFIDYIDRAAAHNVADLRTAS